MFSGGLRRYLIAAIVLAVVVLLYTVAGFWGVPRLLRSQLQSYVAQHYHRTLALGDIRFNPFTLELEVLDLALPDADGQPLLSFRRLLVNLDVASLWRRGPSFAEIALDAPYTRVVVRKGGSVNLADLAPPDEGTSKPPETESSPLRLYIGKLAIRDGRSNFEDDTRTQPFRAELKPINFELHDFSTVAQTRTGNSYALSGASELGERFSWSGTIHLNPLVSSGHFELNDVRMRTLWSYASDSLPFEIASGTLNLGGDYDVRTARAGLGVQATVHQLTVAQLGVKPKNAPASLLDVQRIEVREAALDVGKRAVNIGKVLVSGVSTHAVLDEHGRLNLLDLMGPADSAAAGGAEQAPAPVAPGSAQPPAPASMPWTVSAPDLEVAAVNITAEDRQVSPAAALSVTDFGARVGGFTTAAGATLKIDADARINQDATLKVSGNVTPEHGAVDATVELTKLDLRAFQPYLARQTQLKLLSGVFGTTIKLNRAADGSLDMDADTEITGLRTVDTALKTDFVKWDRLQVKDAHYRAPAKTASASLRIGSVLAQGPYARVIIAKDHTVNVSDALQPPGTPRPVQTQTTTVKGGKASARVAPPPAAQTGAAPALAMSVGTIRIANGSANFADLSIQPNFAIGIQMLNGSITGLSSDPASRAKVLLDGKVDRYAPAHIEGEINVLSAAAYSDIRMSFKGIEMTTATPYSGHFAGYKIEKGKLTADLAYKVENRKLDATHRIVIDQLQLGDRVESPDAVHLPLRIAVALLKDRNGVIDISLPITGSLDDPKFSVGPIIWKAVLNLLTKIVTAPFALLGSLFGGGEQMNQIDFAPGTAVLDAAAQERLAGLLKALKERPQLQLDVPMVYSTELDTPILVAQRFDTELAALERGGAAGAGQDPAGHYQLLLALHRAQLGKDAPLPAEAQALEAIKKGKRDPEQVRSAIAALDGELRAAIKVPDEELQALGKRRSAAIQDALLAGGEVDAARIFVINAPPKPGADNVVRVEMSLK